MRRTRVHLVVERAKPVRLYRGSNVEVAEPQIIASARALDFGPGFYTTSSLAQAERWARLQARRRREGSPIVSVYEFDEEAAAKELEVLRFEKADGAWLDFVAAHRKNLYDGPSYDIAIGPVANDNTMPVVSDYVAGEISQETALVLLMPQKLTDQYAFSTERALSMLDFAEAIEHAG